MLTSLSKKRGLKWERLTFTFFMEAAMLVYIFSNGAPLLNLSSKNCRDIYCASQLLPPPPLSRKSFFLTNTRRLGRSMQLTWTTVFFQIAPKQCFVWQWLHSISLSGAKKYRFSFFLCAVPLTSVAGAFVHLYVCKCEMLWQPWWALFMLCKV